MDKSPDNARVALIAVGRKLMAIEDTVPIAKEAQGIILAALAERATTEAGSALREQMDRQVDAALYPEGKPFERTKLPDRQAIAQAVRSWLAEQDDVPGSAHAYLSNRDDLLAEHIATALEPSQSEPDHIGGAGISHGLFEPEVSEPGRDMVLVPRDLLQAAVETYDGEWGEPSSPTAWPNQFRSMLTASKDAADAER